MSNRLTKSPSDVAERKRLADHAAATFAETKANNKATLAETTRHNKTMRRVGIAGGVVSGVVGAGIVTSGILNAVNGMKPKPAPAPAASNPSATPAQRRRDYIEMYYVN